MDGKEHGLPLQMSLFLGPFAKLRKATFNFVMSALPSFRPHGLSRLSLDGFSRKFIFDYFSKTCWEKSNFIKIWQE